MNKLIAFFGWMSAWIAGCVVFDMLLGLTGPWLMLGGAVTYVVANSVERSVRFNVEFSGGAPLFGAASAGTQGYASGDENE